MNHKTILFTWVVIIVLHLTTTLNQAAAITVFAGNTIQTQSLAEQYENLAEEHFFKKKAGVSKTKLDVLEKRLRDLQKELLSQQGVVQLNVPPDLYATDLQRVKNEALDRMNKNKLRCRLCKVRSAGGALVFENQIGADMYRALGESTRQYWDEQRRQGRGGTGLPRPRDPRDRGFKGCPPGFLPYGQGCTKPR
ncbi:MAG: hypothetical protein NPINA01_05610 [Nitrospinaceae bacterium]|nr:MAG: hypothetical protein NPINA01_05610 [Nitrospinaceae bacterium]